MHRDRPRPLRRPARRRSRRAGAALLAALVLSATTGCNDLIDPLIGGEGPAADAAAAAEEAAAATAPYPSQFTRDGTFQSHEEVDGIDFVYTLYPTKATPRTHEWFPRGDKFFTFTLQAYDLEQDLRAPFARKREVYLGRISVTSQSLAGKGVVTRGPYELDAQAREVTFDPEPLRNSFGMLITSPKGSLEMRNQRIGTLPDGSRAVVLRFVAVVRIETAPGSDRFDPYRVKQTVPIGIFPSSTPTISQEIPYTAN